MTVTGTATYTMDTLSDYQTMLSYLQGVPEVTSITENQNILQITVNLTIGP